MRSINGINKAKKTNNGNYLTRMVFKSYDDFKCKHCNTFNGKNKASLGTHIKNCKFNLVNKSNGTIIINA